MIAVRQAAATDYDGICALYAQLDALHVEAHPDRFLSVEPARSRQWLDDLLVDDDRGLLVAERDGAVAGFADLYVRRGAAHSVHIARVVGVIDGIVVDPQYRGQGVGKALLAAATAWFESHAVVEIELTVYAFNEDAIHFYEANGFRRLLVRLTRPSGAEQAKAVADDEQ